MAAMYGTRTAPLAIPPFRRRDPTPLSPNSDEDGLGISPDMLFAMSVEPEANLHAHMTSPSRHTPNRAPMDRSTRDSLDSFDALFTRNNSHQNHSPAHTPLRPQPAPRSVSALTSSEEPLLYAFPTSSSRRGPLSLPQHHHRARGFGASPSLLLPTSTSAFNTQSLSNYHNRPRADREINARARAIVASSRSRHTSPPTSSSTSSATSSRSSSPARYRFDNHTELDTSAATSLASSRSPSQTRGRHQEASPGKPGSQQSSAETVSAMLSEALRNDMRLGRGSPLAPKRIDKTVAAWNHPSKTRATVTAPRVSMDVAESYKPGGDEGLMRKAPGSPTPAPVVGRDGQPMNPLRVLAAYADRGRRRAT